MLILQGQGRFRNLKGIQNLGGDSLGQIVGVGKDVCELSTGDYVTSVFCQSYSEYTTPKAVDCFKVPMPYPEYAALRVAGTCSCCISEVHAQFQKGMTVLVTAACGGVGHVISQIAKLHGCHVIGTCGGPIKKAKLLQLGLDRVVDYTKEVKTVNSILLVLFL